MRFYRIKPEYYVIKHLKKEKSQCVQSTEVRLLLLDFYGVILLIHWITVPLFVTLGFNFSSVSFWICTIWFVFRDHIEFNFTKPTNSKRFRYLDLHLNIKACKSKCGPWHSNRMPGKWCKFRTKQAVVYQLHRSCPLVPPRDFRTQSAEWNQFIKTGTFLNMRVWTPVKARLQI